MRFKTFTNLTILVFAIVFLFDSCRKANKDADVPQPETLSNSFFNSHLPTDPTVEAVRQYVISQDRQFKFSDRFQAAIGNPIWDKAISNRPENTNIGNRGEESEPDSTIVYVPFVRVDEDVVNASLIVKMKENDTTFRMLYDWEYRYFGYDLPANDAWNAQDVFHMFTLLDQSVFGRTEFAIRDIDLLPEGLKSSLEAAQLDFDSLSIVYTINDSAAIQGRYAAPITVCTDYTYCVEYQKLAFRENTQRALGTQFRERQCLQWGSYRECTTYWVDVSPPSSGGGSGGSTGGGGGGGWTSPNPNPPPCPGVPEARNVPPVDPNAPPCTSGPGWTPPSTPPFPLTFVNGIPVLDNLIVVKYHNLNSAFWNNVGGYYTSGSHVKFTTQNLRNLCNNRGWQTGVTPLEFNRKVGKAFEETALKFYGLTENRYNYNAPGRALKNAPNPPTMVRPDAMDNFTCRWTDQNNQSHMAQLEKVFGVEVKAYSGTLELSTNSWQILGELELLRKNFDDQANTPYWRQLTPALTITSLKEGPILFFITTDDTQIGQTIIDKARQLGITIWQAKAVYNQADGKLSFDPIRYIYDKAGYYLNGQIVPRNMYNALIPGGTPDDVPMNLLTPVQPNFDVDPEEIP